MANFRRSTYLTRYFVERKVSWFGIGPTIVENKPEIHRASIGWDNRIISGIFYCYRSSGLGIGPIPNMTTYGLNVIVGVGVAVGVGRDVGVGVIVIRGVGLRGGVWVGGIHINRKLADIV